MTLHVVSYQRKHTVSWKIVGVKIFSDSLGHSKFIYLKILQYIYYSINFFAYFSSSSLCVYSPTFHSVPSWGANLAALGTLTTMVWQHQTTPATGWVAGMAVWLMLSRLQCSLDSSIKIHLPVS